MAAKVIRVGVVGCGGIANVHMKGINASRDLSLAAICDILPEKMEEKGKLYGVEEKNWFESYTDMMDSGLVDAITVATPNDIHYEVTMAAIERGIPFAVEKPVCNSEAEVRRLLDLAEEKKIPHMVNFSYRFKSAARYAREIVQSGQLGTIYHINGEYLQSWGLNGASKDGEMTPLVWRFIKEHTGSGALGDLGCHLMDLVRFITGKEFVYFHADADTFIKQRPKIDESGMGDVTVDDYITIAGQLEDKIATDLNITRFAYGRGNYQRVEVYGEKGALRYNLEDETGDTLEINMGNRPMRDGHCFMTVPIPERCFSDQLQSFADIINGTGDGLAATLADGVVNARLVDKTLEAVETGSKIVI